MADSEPSDFWGALISLTFQSENQFSFFCRGWRFLMADFLSEDALGNWVRGNGKIPDGIPCPEACHCHDCGSLSIRRNGGGYVAECPQKKIPEQPYSEKDLTIQEYDAPRLHDELVQCLPNTIIVHRNAIAAFTWLIGQTFRGIDRKTRKIFISYLNPPQLWSVAPYLIAAEGKAQIVLLTPFMNEIPDREKLAYNSMNIDLVPLKEHFGINRLNGFPELVSLPPAIADFLAFEDMKALRRTIPVPAFTRWPDIHIIFQDQYTVSCYLKGRNYTRSYEDFGMVNIRNRTPNLLWRLLVSFSANRGRLKVDWPTKQKAALDQQRKHRLDQVLRDYFKIDSPAISFSYEQTEYVCNFVIADETHSSHFHRNRRNR